MYRAAHCYIVFFFFFLLRVFLTALKLIVPSILYLREMSVASCPLVSYFSRAETSKCQAFSAAIFVLARLHFVHLLHPSYFRARVFSRIIFIHEKRSCPREQLFISKLTTALLVGSAVCHLLLLTNRMLLLKTELVAN